MIDIYDEVGYIKEVLENGLSSAWKRDLTLLTKYYHLEGKSKVETKDILKKKCNTYVDGYDPYTSYKTVNSIIDRAWKDETPLREIREIKIPKEVLQWFFDLEKVELSDEQLDELKEYYKQYRVVVNKQVYTFNRVKYLFTLFVWGLIQKEYLDFAWSIDTERYKIQLRKDANLSTSFKLKIENNLLYDLGMINITNGGKNRSRKVILNFIENYDVFKKEYADDDCITLSGADMYNCGYWLEKQRYGTFVCQHCGQEFAHYGDSKQEKGRKYCKKCSDITHNHKFDGEIKIITCVDCGKDVEVDINDVKTCRCADCYSQYRKDQVRTNVRRYREKNKM